MVLFIVLAGPPASGKSYTQKKIQQEFPDVIPSVFYEWSELFNEEGRFFYGDTVPVDLKMIFLHSMEPLTEDQLIQIDKAFGRDNVTVLNKLCNFPMREWKYETTGVVVVQGGMNSGNDYNQFVDPNATVGKGV